MPPSPSLEAREVGVEVGLEAERQAESAPARRATVGIDVAGWVDDEPTAVAEVDEVRRVTELLVDEGG